MKFAPKRDMWLSLVMYFCIIALAWAGASPWVIGGTGIIGGTLLSLFCLGIAGVTAKVIPLDKIASGGMERLEHNF